MRNLSKKALALILVLAALLIVNSAYAAGITYPIRGSITLTTEDPRTDPEAVIIRGERTSTAPFGTGSVSTRAIDDVSVIKGSAIFHETGVGAHYYAFGGRNTNYSEAFTNVKLPNRLNVGERNAYISLGIHGEQRGVDLGITNTGSGWMPCYYDGHSGTFATYPGYVAPSSATSAIMTATIIDTATVQLYVQFTDASGNYVGTSFWKQLPVAEGNFTYVGGKVRCQFYRFASLVPKHGTTDNQMDSTYMLNGQFTGCQLYNGSSYVSWGIGSSNMVNVWKVSPERISVSYTGTTDTFSIDHWYG